MWAEECQKTAWPSSSSNLINAREQEFSKGRSKSQTSPLTLATTELSARPWLIPFATWWKFKISFTSKELEIKSQCIHSLYLGTFTFSLTEIFWSDFWYQGTYLICFDGSKEASNGHQDFRIKKTILYVDFILHPTCLSYHFIFPKPKHNQRVEIRNYTTQFWSLWN